MSITGSNNPFACNPVVFANANSIVSLGTITREGNQFTFSVGFVWEINGVTYQNTTPVVLTIAEASEGFQRIDNALLNTSNTIELQQGLESDTIALRPVAPETNIILTSWNISGTTIGDAEASILGSQFKKKSESLGYGDPTLTGSEAVIQLRPEGSSRYAFPHAGLVSIDGFGLYLITGNPDAEAPYPGKDLFIENTGTTPFSLLHQGAGDADSKFFFLDETDLVVPPGGKVWLKYDPSYCEMIFKSWSEVDLSTKLDKDITPESVYATDENGEQVMKSLSEISGDDTFTWSPTTRAVVNTSGNWYGLNTQTFNNAGFDTYNFYGNNIFPLVSEQLSRSSASLITLGRPLKKVYLGVDYCNWFEMDFVIMKTDYGINSAFNTRSIMSQPFHIVCLGGSNIPLNTPGVGPYTKWMIEIPINDIEDTSQKALCSAYQLFFKGQQNSSTHGFFARFIF